MSELTYAGLAKMLDHSLLQPTLTDRELEEGCLLARAYDVASVCIKPYGVRRAAELLSDFTVAVGTTVGFPHGGHLTAGKGAAAGAGPGRDSGGSYGDEGDPRGVQGAAGCGVRRGDR